VESSRQLAWKDSCESVAENKERMREDLGVVKGRIFSRLQPGEKGIALGKKLMVCGCSLVPGRNGKVLQVTWPKNQAVKMMVMMVMVWNWCKAVGGPRPGLEGWPNGL
jgi:hypothetical protein